MPGSKAAALRAVTARRYLLMAESRYVMSFTTGGLFLRESVKAAELFPEIQDWGAVKKRLVQENTYQARTIKSLKRNVLEVLSRLKCLDDYEISFLIQGCPQDQRALLWLAVCRRYLFIAEFASQVLRERFLTFHTRVGHDDFDWFFNRRAEWDENLETITPASRGKLRQVLFRIMREAELITGEYVIIPALLSQEFMDLISRGDRREFAYFPLSEKDLKG